MTFKTAEPSVRRACGQGIDAVELCGVKLDRVKALSAIEAIDAIRSSSCKRKPHGSIFPVLMILRSMQL